MAVFANAEQLYGVAADLFSRLETENPQAVAQLLRARLLIRLACRNPAAEIWIHSRQPPLQVYLGHQRLHPDLEARLEGDTLHQILAGNLPLSGAVKGGMLQVKGQVWKVKALSDLLAHGQAIYPQILRAHGLNHTGR
jgi:hypothetical protein